MKKIILTSILICLAIICKADYRSIFLPGLIEKSELIAHIKIVKDLNGNFEAEILNQIKGKINSKKIIVKKFEDWTCAQRWSKYLIGQEELIFLKKHKKENYWVIMGAGNEGEMPIEKEILYYKSPIYKSKYFEEEKFCELKNGKITAVKFELDIAIEGIKSYLNEIEKIKEKLDNKTLIKFYPKNKFYLRAINEKILRNRWKFDEAEIEKRKFIKK